MLDPADQLQRGVFTIQVEHALADILGKVADPLDLVGNAQRTDHIAQVHRHRLAAGDGEDGALLDVALQGIDLRVGRDQFAGQRGVAPRQRLHAIGNLPLRKAPHFRKHAVEVLQIGVEGLGDMFCHNSSPCECGGEDQPKRPVM